MASQNERIGTNPAGLTVTEQATLIAILRMAAKLMGPIVSREHGFSQDNTAFSQDLHGISAKVLGRQLLNERRE